MRMCVRAFWPRADVFIHMHMHMIHACTYLHLVSEPQWWLEDTQPRAARELEHTYTHTYTLTHIHTRTYILSSSPNLNGGSKTLSLGLHASWNIHTYIHTYTWTYIHTHTYILSPSPNLNGGSRTLNLGLHASRDIHTYIHIDTHTYIHIHSQLVSEPQWWLKDTQPGVARELEHTYIHTYTLTHIHTHTYILSPSPNLNGGSRTLNLEQHASRDIHTYIHTY